MFRFLFASFAFLLSVFNASVVAPKLRIKITQDMKISNNVALIDGASFRQGSTRGEKRIAISVVLSRIVTVMRK